MSDRLDSCSEFYMQIFEKYKKDYGVAIAHFKKEKRRVEDALSEIEGLRIYPSQSAFIVVEFDGKISVDEVEKRLLLEDNILVRRVDGNTKTVRFSINVERENNRMINALARIMNKEEGVE